MDIERLLVQLNQGQMLRVPQMKDGPVFLRNLEEAMEVRRTDHALFTRTMGAWTSGRAIDFCSNDLLSVGSSGTVRTALLQKLEAYPGFSLYAGDSGLINGNYSYTEEVEKDIADFHGAESALLVGSGYEANSLAHASTHDGRANCMANSRTTFRHNDAEAFREALVFILDLQLMVRNGQRSLLVAVESVYNMGSDVWPLVELLNVARDICPKGNAQLGLKKEIAIRLHTCRKVLASTGGECCPGATLSVRTTIMNFARSVIYTTEPSFLTVAAVRVGYNLMKSVASSMGTLSVSLRDDCDDRDFLTHIVPIWTRQRYNYFIVCHLQLNGICAFPIDYLTSDVDQLVACLCKFASEIIDIERDEAIT
ncbi:5-aminolevulinate synthase [Xylariaceae sp. FL0804]|nr:5-aminolevulinate synthase [Xylariaceae sp. FL0804]